VHATKYLKHSNLMVMDVDCKCVPGVRLTDFGDSWSFLIYITRYSFK